MADHINETTSLTISELFTPILVTLDKIEANIEEDQHFYAELEMHVDFLVQNIFDQKTERAITLVKKLLNIIDGKMAVFESVMSVKPEYSWLEDVVVENGSKDYESIKFVRSKLEDVYAKLLDHAEFFEDAQEETGYKFKIKLGVKKLAALFGVLIKLKILVIPEGKKREFCKAISSVFYTPDANPISVNTLSRYITKVDSDAASYWHMILIPDMKAVFNKFV